MQLPQPVQNDKSVRSKLSNVEIEKPQPLNYSVFNNRKICVRTVTSARLIGTGKLQTCQRSSVFSGALIPTLKHISTRIILSDARERYPRPFFGNKLPLKFKWWK